MQKQIISPVGNARVSGPSRWLDLEKLARAELTSEDPAYPLEAALVSDDPANGAGRGWRSALAGRQTVRLIFQEPQRLRTVSLVFREEENPRTQEFVLRWAKSDNEPAREILRQQFHFSPPATVEEREVYTVELDEVGVLELEIIPNISGGGLASLQRMKLAAD